MSIRLSAPKSIVRALGARPATGRAEVEVHARRQQVLAALYDEQATCAYRVALLVLGDSEAAARAVETTFLGIDLDRLPSGARAVRAEVLRLLHQTLNRHPPNPPSNRHVLADLAPQDRQALAYCLNGASVTEVAELLDLEPAETHARLGRALRALHALRRLGSDV